MAVIDTMSRGLRPEVFDPEAQTRRAQPEGFTYRLHALLMLSIASIVFTAFHIAEVYNELDIHKKERLRPEAQPEGEQLNLSTKGGSLPAGRHGAYGGKLQTFEKLSALDAGRYFWTVFIRNAILRENPNLNPVEVIEWANVWYLICSVTGEDIPLTLAIARIESTTWEATDTGYVLVCFNLNAVSSKGALGLFQLMSSTAREVADKLGIYYDRSVKSPRDAIARVSRDTLISQTLREKLIRDVIFEHIETYPGSIEAVTLNPVNNIRMGIYYLTHLRKFNLPLEGTVESYNAGPAGHISGRAREVTVPYREKVLLRYEGYKKKADSARFELMKDEFGTEGLLSIPNSQVNWLKWTIDLAN